MAAVEIGRLCVKLAGRDAGRAGLIVELMDKNFVVVDGNTRRKRVNIDHLELLSQRADIKQGASHEEVIKALESVPAKKKKPTCIIAHTVLGKGVSFMEDELLWHYQIPSDEQVKQALEELKIS